MKIKFVGPEPVISQTYITFDNNKDDKFIYLNIAVQLLKAFHSNKDIKDKTYTYNVESRRLNNDEIYESILHYCSDVYSVIQAHEKHAEVEVENNLQRAKDNMLLNDTQRASLIKNISMMRDYVIQRAVNKAVYYRVINALADELKKDKINYLVAPMFQNFAYIFNSIQSTFYKQKVHVNTAIDIYEEDGRLLLKLTLKGL